MAALLQARMLLISTFLPPPQLYVSCHLLCCRHKLCILLEMWPLGGPKTWGSLVELPLTPGIPPSLLVFPTLAFSESSLSFFLPVGYGCPQDAPSWACPGGSCIISDMTFPRLLMMHGFCLEAIPEWVEVRPIPRPGDLGTKVLAASFTILDKFEQT